MKGYVLDNVSQLLACLGWSMDQVRDIFHVDVDAFFASVEQALHPELRGKPVIVGGNPEDRSVVAAASYEARRYGVHSAMPISQARRLCPDAIFVRGHFDDYIEYSRRIEEILHRYAPRVEATSLDDFYMDLTGCRPLHGAPMEAAEKLKREIKKQTGLNVTIGIAANSTVAKIASELGKPNGILEVWRGSEEAFLRNLPVERLPGVGPSTAETLHKYNIQTVGELARLTPEMLRQAFGVWGTSLWEHAHGRDDSEVATERAATKSIGRETTFRADTADRAELRATLYDLTEHVARQLREEHFMARRVTVKVRYADFTTVTSARTLAEPTDRDDAFYEAAAGKLEELLQKRRMQVRLIGVTLSALGPAGERQGKLFDEEGPRRRRKFYEGLDKLREKFGHDIARVGPSLRLPREDEVEEPKKKEKKNVRKGIR